MNILFVSSEAYPLIKTGGLADVAGSLPVALQELGEEARLLLPAYRSVMAQVKGGTEIASTHHYGQDIRIIETTMADSGLVVWLVDCPAAFDRPGNPYVNEYGSDWPDNAFRFALFCQVAVDVALNRLVFDWPVDLVHCNDWQTGLVPALLSRFDQAPATVFTIHNLAYMGIFPAQTYFDLGLPPELWTMDGLEFHGLFSFIKGGLVFADRINTVSPGYAGEIQQEQFGYGLTGLLQYRSGVLSGILNGIDPRTWDPASDPHLVANYSATSLDDKTANKIALQQEFGLANAPQQMLVGMISRLVDQKGLDLILEALPEMLKLPVQFIFLGSGEARYQHALAEFAAQNPDSVAVYIGYDEALSHRIEAACDLYLMPSLFEPCGLNQLYSLRYGTLPLVTAVGGLADSVQDADAVGTAGNGFVMPAPNAGALLDTFRRAQEVWQDAERWQGLQKNAMAIDHSWRHSGAEYIELYRQVVSD